MEGFMKEIDILFDGTKQLFEEFFTKEANKKQRANMWTFTRLVLPFLIVIHLLNHLLVKKKEIRKYILLIQRYLLVLQQLLIIWMEKRQGNITLLANTVNF